MTKLLPEHLDRPPEEVSRILVLARLDDTAAAAERLQHPEDTEALHDFRVALRRLRSCIRAYRPYLKGSIPKKVRKALRRLASSTNMARDAEVQQAWLNAQSERLSERELNGLRWLVERLEEKGVEPSAERFQRVTAHLGRIQKTLTKKLSSWRVRLEETQRGSFRTVVGSLMLKQVESLSVQLRTVRTAEDDPQAHAARISAKRLRYLMEPISKAVPEVRPLLQKLKGLQDSLGDLHDTNLLVATVGAAMEASAVEAARRLHRQAVRPAGTYSDDESSGERVEPREPGQPGQPGQEEQPGLLALARLLHQRRESLFRDIDSRWHGEGLEEFAAEVSRLGVQLRATPGRPTSVRRFRLSELPHVLETRPGTLVEEGWLPGGEIEDRLRRERSRGRVRHYRLVRLYSETRCFKIPRRVFAGLWPLTDGRRLRRTRYELSEGGRLWRIDDLGGNVLLAETELSVDDEALPLPDWLVPCLREELTGPWKPPPPSTARRKSPAKQTGAGKSEETSSRTRPPTQTGASQDSYSESLPSNGRGNAGSATGPTPPPSPAQPRGKG